MASCVEKIGKTTWPFCAFFLLNEKTMLFAALLVMFKWLTVLLLTSTLFIRFVYIPLRRFLSGKKCIVGFFHPYRYIQIFVILEYVVMEVAVVNVCFGV